jgi:hypothetical protein
VRKCFPPDPIPDLQPIAFASLFRSKSEALCIQPSLH